MIGIQLDNTDLKKELNGMPTYLKYKSIWYHEEIPDRLMMFLCKIYDAHSVRLSVIYPIFAKYIGSPLDKNKEEYTHIHHVIKQSVIQMYNETGMWYNSETIDDETLREININYIIS